MQTMASSKSSVELNRIFSSLKLKSSSQELFEKLNEEGRSITFDNQGIPIV